MPCGNMVNPQKIKDDMEEFMNKFYSFKQKHQTMMSIPKKEIEYLRDWLDDVNT